MSWLAHHEFGSDHRPFVFSDYNNPYAPESLNYWLYLWIHVYGWLQENHPSNTLFCSYENLCRSGDTSWTRIAVKTGIDADGPVFEPLVLRESRITETVDAELVADAHALYDKLVQLETLHWHKYMGCLFVESGMSSGIDLQRDLIFHLNNRGRAGIFARS